MAAALTLGAVQTPLFAWPHIGPSESTVSGEGGGLDRARYELHRALDFGNDADLAAWGRRWGESLCSGVLDEQHERRMAEGAAESAEAELSDMQDGADPDDVKFIEAELDDAAAAVSSAEAIIRAAPQGPLTAVRDLEDAAKAIAAAAKRVGSL